MTVRLRPHHLLCILTYVGRGYSRDFTSRMDQIVDRLRRGDDCLIVEGPDDICAPLLTGSSPHCLRSRIRKRDAAAILVLGTVLEPAPVAGQRLSLQADRVEALRRAFAAGVLRPPCTGCQWHDLCTGVANEGFTGTRL